MGKDCIWGDSGCLDTVGSTMTTCPVCKGEGKAIKGNGVDPQREPEVDTCWLCGGHGKVEETPTEKMHIKKYWNVTADCV